MDYPFPGGPVAYTDGAKTSPSLQERADPMLKMTACAVMLWCCGAATAGDRTPAIVLVPPPYGEGVRHVQGRLTDTQSPAECWMRVGHCTGAGLAPTFWAAELNRISYATDDTVEFSLFVEHATPQAVLWAWKQMAWTIDGEEFTTPIRYALEVRRDKGKTRYEESYETRIPLDRFRSLANSVQARVQFGDFLLDWYEADRDGMRQFMSHWPRGGAGQFTIETDPEIEAALAEQAAEKAAGQTEQKAAAALRGIERHILPKQPAKARQLLRELIERYPGTPSARRAEELLP